MERTRAYQKRCSASKDIKKKPQWDGRTGTLAKWCNPIPPGAQSTGWRIIILQKFSHRSDSSKPHIRLPGLGGLAWGRGGAPRAFGFEGQQGLIAGAPGDWEKQRLHSWKAHTGSFTCWDPGQTQWIYRSLSRTYLLVLEGLLGRRGVAVALSGSVDTGGGDFWECSATWTLKVADIWLGSSASRPGPTQKPVGSSAGTTQAKQQTGWEHRPTHQQTGCLKTSWAISRHTPWHGPAHQRAKTQLHPLVDKHRPLLPGSLHKPLNQPQPPGGRHQKQENYSSPMQARPYPGTS